MELQEVHRRLEHLPALKARNAEEAENAKLEFEKVEQTFKVLHAKKTLKFRTIHPEDTVAAIKARLDCDDELIQAELSMRKAEATWRLKVVMMQSLDDQFTAVKMIARIKIAEIGGRVSFD